MAKQKLSIGLSGNQGIKTKLVPPYQLRVVSELLEGTPEDSVDSVNKAVMDNPVLEVTVDKGQNGSELHSDDSEDISHGGIDGYPEGDYDGDGEAESMTGDNPMEPDPESSGYDRYEGNTGDDPNEGSTGNGQDRAVETLYEYLVAQLAETNLDERQRLIATHIVGNLDDRGFLAADPYDIAYDIFNQEFLDVTEDEVLEVLNVVQTFEPLGVGARNLQECLLIQLKQRHTQYTGLAIQMVTDHFGDFMNQRIERLAKALKVTEEEVKNIYRKEIHKLDPKPAGAYSVDSDDRMQQIMPTFEVKVEDGKITFEIPNYFPALHVSKEYSNYYNSLKQKKGLTEEEKRQRAEILKNINKAEGYLEAMKMRQETLTRTMNAIIHIQRDYFLDYGDRQSLKPMKLKDLAELAGRDESTLSRATSDKYMSTPWGTIPLKLLFAEGITVAGGEVANKAIQDAIAQLVNNEDKKKPLSDQTIAEMVNKQLGCDIARRTVNKYRHVLNIPSASIRKRQL